MRMSKCTIVQLCEFLNVSIYGNVRMCKCAYERVCEYEDLQRNEYINMCECTNLWIFD